MPPFIKPVILCGGSGTRLWPLSTPKQPKQFQALTSQSSMISLTVERLKGDTDVVTFTTPLIIGSERHKHLLDSALPQADVLLEPMGRNSAPAIAAACLMSDPDTLLLVLPADHHIADPAAFRRTIAVGCGPAMEGDIVTFGIVPTHPATGYGYIRTEGSDNGIYKVSTFVEKPRLDVAQSYLDTGGYYWNAGIFLFRVSTMLDAFAEHASDVIDAVKSCLPSESDALPLLDAGRFAQVPDISIDYAIMEKAKQISLVPADMGWSDVGGFAALRDLGAEDSLSSVNVGSVVSEQTTGSYIRSNGPTVAVSGLENMVVVATPDTVMIAPIDDDSAVKRLGGAAQEQPLALSLSSSTRHQAKTLLWDTYDHWLERAWDDENGGFVESLDLKGEPQTKLDRRIRVQARQVFSFAEAIRLGWAAKDQAAELVHNGLDFLDQKCRHPESGWVHMLNSECDVVDQSRGLYDHAFIMMAGAAAWRSTGSSLAKRLAEEARDFVDSHLSEETLGGFADGLDMTAARRANPHMHLLEAFLEWHRVTGDQDWLDRATRIVHIFEERLFINRDDMLREHFTEHWTPEPGERGQIFEPGHQYEWASLLADHQERTGLDTASWRRRLIRKADRDGRDLKSGFAHNEVHRNGTVTNPNRRLWPQLEAFRARLWHPETAAPGAANLMLSRIAETYFDSMPKGLWMDETDIAGAPKAPAVPASMIYHIVTAFRDILPATD